MLVVVFTNTASITMLVNVKTLTGRIMQFDVAPTDLVKELLHHIVERTGIDPVQLRIIHKGSMVSPMNTIEKSNINAGDTVHIVLSLRGG